MIRSCLLIGRLIVSFGNTSNALAVERSFSAAFSFYLVYVSVNVDESMCLCLSNMSIVTSSPHVVCV